jgi:hypothetical protein
MDLLRRMPPSLSQQALNSLLALLPAHSSELLSQSDQPLQVAWDEEHDKHYLLCDYNRDGDSYRSFVLPLLLLFGACGVPNLLMFLHLGHQQGFLDYYLSGPRGLVFISRNWRTVCSHLLNCELWNKRLTRFSPSIVTSEITHSQKSPAKCTRLKFRP